MSNDLTAVGQTVPIERLQAVNRRPPQSPPPAPSAAASLATLVPTVPHTVQAGETLSGIAAKYAANKPADMDMTAWVQTIQVMNGLGDRDTIKVGQVLQIPQLVTGGERLEATARPAGPYDPAAGLTFPAGTAGQAPGSNAAPAATTTSAAGTATPPATQTTEPPDWRQQVLTTARDTLGTRYVWGGTSLERGVDCSGLTQGLFNQVGVELPRTSGAQFAAGGREVKREDLQPGDLVFFRNSKGRICHVGVYSGRDDQGRQMYISATNSKGVAEYSIDGWVRNTRQRYAGARRFEAPAQPPAPPPAATL